MAWRRIPLKTLRQFLTPAQLKALEDEAQKNQSQDKGKDYKGEGKGRAGQPVSGNRRSGWVDYTKGKAKDESRTECICCGKVGHLMASCWHNPAAANSSRQEGSTKAATVPTATASDGGVPRTPFPWYCLECSQPHTNPGVRRCINPECNFIRTKEERLEYAAKAKVHAKAEAERKGLLPPTPDAAVLIDSRGPASHIRDRMAVNAADPDPQSAFWTESERLNVKRKALLTKQLQEFIDAGLEDEVSQLKDRIAKIPEPDPTRHLKDLSDLSRSQAQKYELFKKRCSSSRRPSRASNGATTTSTAKSSSRSNASRKRRRRRSKL
jgi:hypothetical protein